MDEWNAPQWTDLTSSPQLLCDDYFDREHEEHEPQLLNNVNAEPLLVTAESKTNLLAPLSAESELENELNTVKSTPVKVISPTLKNKNKTVKETTYDNVILQAMSNLQLSTKKKLKMVPPVASSISDHTKVVNAMRISKSMNFHVPSNYTPMQNKKMQVSQGGSTASHSSVSSTEISGKSDIVRNDKVLIGDCEEIKDEKPNIDGLTKSIDKSIDTVINVNQNTMNSNHVVDHELENINESSINEDTIEGTLTSNADVNQKSKNINEIKSNIVMTFNKCEVGMSEIRKNVSNKSRPRFSTCQFRRRSLIKYRRQSNQYVSLAEAVLKFQSGTPKRFRTTSKKDIKSSSLLKTRQSTLKITHAVSPVLQSKLRARRITVMSQEERENLEMEEIKKHPIKANPVRASTLKGPMPLKKVETKSLTIPEPFQLTKNKRSYSSSHQTSNQESMLAREHKQEILVPKVVSSDGDSITVKEVKILHFGIPVRSDCKKITQAVPFSFEMRNKEFQKKKEEKLKQLQTEEEKKAKADFHAKPVPVFKKPMTPVVKEVNVHKPKTKPCPFSFEERDKQLVKKKEELIKHVLEEDKKARKFHANPVPEFKPVIIRGASKENINLDCKNITGQKSRVSQSITVKKNTKSNLLTKMNISNQENKGFGTKAGSMDDLPSRPRTGNLHKESMVLTELNTDKRAKERREFDNKIKQKEMEKEEIRRKEEEEKLEEDKSKRAEMRKMTEVKARPMPVYKALSIARSSKPLTEPQSPAWNKFKQ